MIAFRATPMPYRPRMGLRSFWRLVVPAKEYGVALVSELLAASVAATNDTHRLVGLPRNRLSDTWHTTRGIRRTRGRSSPKSAREGSRGREGRDGGGGGDCCGVWDSVALRWRWWVGCEVIPMRRSPRTHQGCDRLGHLSVDITPICVAVQFLCGAFHPTRRRGNAHLARSRGSTLAW